MTRAEARGRLGEMGIGSLRRRESLLSRAQRSGQLNTTTARGRPLTISYLDGHWAVEAGWRFDGVLWAEAVPPNLRLRRRRLQLPCAQDPPCAPKVPPVMRLPERVSLHGRRQAPRRAVHPLRPVRAHPLRLPRAVLRDRGESSGW